ncbi:MAG: hypothetical protein JWN70_6118 [Planctomycetaceae bacterium]|nr:hypothetical protein [Planctomycetaceae bacterium]
MSVAIDLSEAAEEEAAPVTPRAEESALFAILLALSFSHALDHSVAIARTYSCHLCDS